MKANRIKTLTKRQLFKICTENKYILIRDGISNTQIGINCKFELKRVLKGCKNNNELTWVISYIPCNINQYINYKIGFI